MAEQEQQELSMDEILASIRNILQEKNEPEKKTKEEVFELTKDMIVEQNKDDVVSEQKRQEFVATFAPDFAVKRAREEKVKEQVSKEIMGSFAKVFDEQAVVLEKPQAAFDAERFLEQIVKAEVEKKLSDEMVNQVIKTKIVPALDNWLKMYLPELIKQEIKKYTNK